MPYKRTKQEQELRDMFENNRVRFLLTELDTAATFCDVALASSDPQKTQRNIDNARTGYATAIELARKARFDERSKAEFEQRLGHLKSLLRNLGQEVEQKHDQ